MINVRESVWWNPNSNQISEHPSCLYADTNTKLISQTNDRPAYRQFFNQINLIYHKRTPSWVAMVTDFSPHVTHQEGVGVLGN